MDVDPKTGVLDCSSAAANAQIDAIAALAPPTRPPRVGGPWAGRSGTRRSRSSASRAPASSDRSGPEHPHPRRRLPARGATDIHRPGGPCWSRSCTARARTRPFELVKDRMNYFAAFRSSRESGICALSPVERVTVAAGPGRGDGNRRGGPAETPWGRARRLPGQRSRCRPHRPPTRASCSTSSTRRSARCWASARGQQRLDEIRTASPLTAAIQRAGLRRFPAVRSRTPPAETMRPALEATRQGRGRDPRAVPHRSLRRAPTRATARREYRSADNHLPDPGHRADRCRSTGGRRARAGHRPGRIPSPRRSTSRFDRAAHELAHSFTLDDEYGGGGTLPRSPRRWRPRPVRQRPVPPDELLRAATFDGEYQVALAAPRACGRLTRCRFWLAPSTVCSSSPARRPTSPAPRQTTDSRWTPSCAFERTRCPASVASHRLRVTQVVGDAEVVRGAGRADPRRGARTETTFPAGSIVMEPKRAPDPPGGLGDDLELLHAGVRQWIEQEPKPARTRFPTHLPAGFTARAPVRSPRILTPPQHATSGLETRPTPPTESAWITGLFEGACNSTASVYHPTGACIMNVIEILPGSSYQFCWVCRYAMVDFIDPAMHGAIDRDYDYRYPK